MIKFNQFSIVKKSFDEKCTELDRLGFTLSLTDRPKKLLADFLSLAPLDVESLQATDKEALTAFLAYERPLSWEVFYVVGLQLLGFVVNAEFESRDSLSFAKETGIPVHEGTLTATAVIDALYDLLCTRTKSGMLLVEAWVAEGLIPVDNQFHFFNDKSLATFDMSQLIREVVYVETPVDTFERGSYDLIKVQIIRPRYAGKLPVVMTASPYHAGTNSIVADKRMHDMTGELAEKSPHTIAVESRLPELPQYEKPEAPLALTAKEHFTHCWTSALNDTLLTRGFASIYVAGVGTRGSEGMQTSGDYQQIYSMRAVIDWLNDRVRAFVDKKRSAQIRATWASGKVATTGKSYLGTMSFGLATTGVDGLEVILAESGISSWYDYYREGGLVRSPGGFPGEDLDVLCELTYSRNMDGSDFLAGNSRYQKALSALTENLARESGDVNQFWTDRNYLLQADKVTCDVLIEHGLQDWNVTPSQAYHFWHALPENVTKHIILHRGAHIYSNNWQSFDYSEIITTYFTAKLLRQPLTLDLPPVLLQENGKYESWRALTNWALTDKIEWALDRALPKVTAAQTSGLTSSSLADKTGLPPHESIREFENHYDEARLGLYSKDYLRFTKDLSEGRANSAVIDLNIPQNLTINGQIELDLTLKITDSKGFLSAQILDFGPKKRLPDHAQVLEEKALDRGRNFQLSNLSEIPLVESPYQLITKGFLNLQNRESLTKILPLPANSWMSVRLTLQPTIYDLAAGDTLRILIYSTDFEHTLRDNRNCTYTLDLSQSTLLLPIANERKNS